MAITDIQISEELETNAPSIKYSGNEGPKSPQEKQMMMADAILEEEYNKYVFDLLEIRPEATPMTLEEFRQMVIAEGQMSKGPILPSPEDPVNPFQPKPQGPVLPDRQMAAYGGIMGVDGRRQYGLGSSLKKFVRKIIPNEVAEVAEKVAPFVAPFNPLAAGIASAVGSFDRTGRVGSSLMSGLKNYGIGQLTRGIGGGMDNLQGMSFRTPQGSFFSSPIQDTGGIGKILSKSKQPRFTPSGNKNVRLDQQPSIFSNAAGTGDASIAEAIGGGGNKGITTVAQEVTQPNFLKNTLKSIGEYIPTSLGDLSDPKKLLGGAGIIFAAKEMLGGGPDKVVSEIMDRGEGLDIAGIRAEVQAAFKDPTGEQLSALRVKYPFLGTQASKNLAAMAMGGRIGFKTGLLVPEDEMTEKTNQMILQMHNRGADIDTISTITEKDAAYINSIISSQNQKAEGGIMDLGGMEKDYRAEGGFVPIGREEKADDVPARLSVNEFVFTADAVRNAGGGDIDKGAEVMENMMKHLEQGGQVSDESQGMAGAQQMFETSERLSEVI
jgi:hypothetical protein